MGKVRDDITHKNVTPGIGKSLTCSMMFFAARTLGSVDVIVWKWINNTSEKSTGL